MITEDAYSIDFDANGGNYIRPLAVSKINNTLTIKDRTFVYKNYAFKWFVDENNEIYKIGDKITLTDNIKLKAVWDYDGGRGGPPDSSHRGSSGGDGSKTIYDNVNENLTMSKTLSASDRIYNGNWIYNPNDSTWSFYITGFASSGVILAPTTTTTTGINSNENLTMGFAINGWYLISDGKGGSNWYYFNNCIMSTGFITTNGITYYCEINKTLPTYGALCLQYS